MVTTAEAAGTPIPWWKEPTTGPRLGWTLDPFDFTIFLLIMVPIAEDFKPDAPGIFGTVLILPGCLLSLSGGDASVEPTKDGRGVGVYPSRI
jgi:SHS family lactate transporter-like MFS transporter